MKNKTIISTIAILMMIILACNFSASTASIKDAYTARSDNGEMKKTAAFAQDEILYCVVELANAPDDTLVKAVWYAVETEGYEANYIVNETEFTYGGIITFHLTSDLLWPAGKYKVELYLDDKVDRTLEFEVVPAAAFAPAASTASVASAYMARDNGGEKQQTTVFTQDDVFYLVVKIANGTQNTAAKATWIAVDVNMEGVEPNSILDEVELVGGEEMTFELSATQLWPLGNYRVEVSIDGVNQGGLDFQVNQ